MAWSGLKLILLMFWGTTQILTTEPDYLKLMSPTIIEGIKPVNLVQRCSFRKFNTSIKFLHLSCPPGCLI